jgi:hypothetical protein
MSTSARPLETIAAELKAALHVERKNIITIGRLLIEAQDAMPHGDWLPWLEENFGSSVSTAENYMNAGRLAEHYPEVTELMLRPTALYRLGVALCDHNGARDDDFYTHEAVAAIFAEAKDQWVSGERASAIANGVMYDRIAREQPPKPVEDQSDEGEVEDSDDDDEADDIDAMLDAPPEDLPPVEVEEAIDRDLLQFDAAIETLDRCCTKPLVTFIKTKYRDRLPFAIDTLLMILELMQDLKPEYKAEYTARLQAVTTQPKIERVTVTGPWQGPESPLQLYAPWFWDRRLNDLLRELSERFVGTGLGNAISQGRRDGYITTKSYNELMNKLHPDRDGGDAELFRRVREYKRDSLVAENRLHAHYRRERLDAEREVARHREGTKVRAKAEAKLEKAKGAEAHAKVWEPPPLPEFLHPKS